MIFHNIQLRLPANSFHTHDFLLQQVANKLQCVNKEDISFYIDKKSLDSRGKVQYYIYKIVAAIKPNIATFPAMPFTSQKVNNKEEVHIIGCGPAGLFCALQCIILGYKPVIIERGKNVRDRRRDLALLNKYGLLNEDSNYCFGEGGAGTYSDGKLYTRSNKRGSIAQVLYWFYELGAHESILYESHPHIGTNKLPHIIERLSNTIKECGGEIHFNSKLTDIHYESDKVKSISINENERIDVKHLVLATGHSADDIYSMLYRKKILMESKPFAMGVRVEHPQALIDQIQYACDVRSPFLPPADYKLVTQVNQIGVFSFCMCPGGIIATASTQQEALVVNGWSPSKRNNIFANSGIVVSVDEKHFGGSDVLAGLHYRLDVERKAFVAGGGKMVAPAQRMTDFVNKKLSNTLESCSYIPGVRSALLHQVLPSHIYQSLREAFVLFNKKMKGYYTREAMIVATESRTSAPIRIPRSKENYHHVQLTNMYPCAEGAGYAGGIVSAAIDGMNVACAISRNK